MNEPAVIYSSKIPYFVITVGKTNTNKFGTRGL